MSAVSPRRIQTTKQAKAAFKARGASYVSDAEKRRLARGAELLERAERIKAGEARKKAWARSREVENGVASDKLGSQRKLDKFGYASSQFHLGKFFQRGAKESAVKAGSEVVLDEPEKALKIERSPEQVVGEQDEKVADPASSPVDGSFFEDVQIRLQSAVDRTTLPSLPSELSPPTAFYPPSESQKTTMMPPPPAKRKMVSIPSLSSDDGLFDAETLQELDRAVDELSTRQTVWTNKNTSPSAIVSPAAARRGECSHSVAPGTIGRAPAPSSSRSMTDLTAQTHPQHGETPLEEHRSVPTRHELRAATSRASTLDTTVSSSREMPPPPLPRPPVTSMGQESGKQRLTSQSRLSSGSVLHGRGDHGISIEDLEAVAMADFVLSQMPAR